MREPDERPWEQPWVSRRDCEPHRGEFLHSLSHMCLGLSVLSGFLLAAGALLTFGGGVFLISTKFGFAYLSASLLGLAVATTVLVLAGRDWERMQAGEMDSRGRELTERAQGNAKFAAATSLVCLLLAVVLPVAHPGPRIVKRGRTPNQNYLKQLGIAMHAYQDHYGTLPPPAIYDADGKPLLSWRVLLLPFLEQESLYQQFHLDEPWDSTHNLLLLKKIPAAFAHPDRPADAKQYKTNYQVLVGKGAAFEEHRAFRLPKDFTDGSSNTILIAQTPAAVPWTKPQDLAYAADKPLPLVGGSSELCEVVLGDASYRYISPAISQTTLRAAITRNGGETLGPDW